MNKKQSEEIDIIENEINDMFDLCLPDCESKTLTGNCDCGGWDKDREIAKYIVENYVSKEALEEQRRSFVKDLDDIWEHVDDLRQLAYKLDDKYTPSEEKGEEDV